MKRFLAILLTLTLLVSLAAPVDAFAASKKKSSKKVVYILTIDNDGVRVRTDVLRRQGWQGRKRAGSP